MNDTLTLIFASIGAVALAVLTLGVIVNTFPRLWHRRKDGEFCSKHNVSPAQLEELRRAWKESHES